MEPLRYCQFDVFLLAVPQKSQKKTSNWQYLNDDTKAAGKK